MIRRAGKNVEFIVRVMDYCCDDEIKEERERGREYVGTEVV
jgi:hypothetical protein